MNSNFIRRLWIRSRIPYIQDLLHTRNQENAVFIWIPKTAGTSIFHILNCPKLTNLLLVKFRFTQKGLVTFGHMDYAQLVSEGYVSQKFDQSAYKFAFVRNPFDRAVSLYYYSKKVKVIAGDVSFLDFCRQLDNSFDSIGLYNRKGLSQCNPQIRWLENLPMDFVGKYENLENDIAFVKDQLGLTDHPVSHLNKSNDNPYPLQYCEDSLEIIRRIYQEDFKTFKYSLTLPAVVQSNTTL